MKTLQSTLSLFFVSIFVLTSSSIALADGDVKGSGSRTGAATMSNGNVAGLEIYRTSFPEGHRCAYAMRDWCMMPNDDGTFSPVRGTRTHQPRTNMRRSMAGVSRANCINLVSPSERRACYRSASWYGNVRIINPLFEY